MVEFVCLHDINIDFLTVNLSKRKLITSFKMNWDGAVDRQTDQGYQYNKYMY